MAQNTSKKNPRRPKGYISAIAINFIHLKNPWVTVWWSAAFPGFGQVIIGSYLKGFLLIIWEIVINVQSKINVAIIYSFTGRFDLAKEVLNTRWTLLYVGIFVYALWDSYRSTVDLNKLSVLADREGIPIDPLKISVLEIHYLDKKNPWVGAAWSALMPGAGHLYTHRLPAGFFILVWWIVITYFSHVLQAVQYTAIGNFSQATAIADPEWLLFMPSIYMFSIFSSYVHTVEYNKLFKTEQAKFLKENYQDPNFDMPV